MAVTVSNDIGGWAAGVLFGKHPMSPRISPHKSWEGFAGSEDTANHLVGGALMGVGGVTAMGCTIGQGLSGLSTLAIGSFLAFAAILAGGVAGLHYQAWRVQRTD